MIIALLFANLVFFFMCYIVGSLMKRWLVPRADNPFLAVLTCLFTGLVVLVSLYAIIVCRGVTMQAFVLSMMFYLAWINRTKHRFSYGVSPWRVLGSAACVVTVALFYQLFVYNGAADIVSGNIEYPAIAPHPDITFYADNSARMNEYGVEGIIYNVVEPLPASNFRIPYHYFDLWVNSLLQFLFPFSKITCYIYIFQPFAYLLTFLSIAAVIRQFAAFPAVTIAILSLMLVFSLEVFTFASRFPWLTTPPRSIEWTKFFSAICCCSLLTCYYARHRGYAITILCLLPLFHILAAPAILAFVFCFGGYLRWQKKDKRFSLHYMILALVIGACLIGFYLVFGAFNHFGNGDTAIQASAVHFGNATPAKTPDTWKYFPGALLVLLFTATMRRDADRKIRRVHNLLTILVILVLASMIAAFVMAQFHRDGIQAKYLPGVAAFRIGLVLLLALVINKRRMLWILPLLAALSFYRLSTQWKSNVSISRKFQQATGRLVPEGSLVGIVYHDRTLKRSPWANNIIGFHYGLEFPLWWRQDVKCISLSASLFADSSGRSGAGLPRTLLEKGMFYRFIQQHSVPGSTLAHYRQQFMARAGIRYLVLEKGVDTSGFFKSMSRHTFTDTISGIQFIAIKNNNAGM